MTAEVAPFGGFAGKPTKQRLRHVGDPAFKKKVDC